MSLYKYLSPDRIVDVLSGATLTVSLASKRNDPFDELCAVDIGDNDEDRRHNAERLRGRQEITFGAISLSEVWDSIPMWSYYADHHRGFVIEFDETHPDFFIKQRTGVLVPIIYDNRVVVRGKLDRKKTPPQFYKAPTWAHEREMRIVMKLKDCRPPFPTVDGRQIYLADHPRDAVTKVFLGCRISEFFKVYVQQNFQQWGFHNAKLIALEPHHEVFAFAAKELALPDTRM